MVSSRRAGIRSRSPSSRPDPSSSRPRPPHPQRTNLRWYRYWHPIAPQSILGGRRQRTVQRLARARERVWRSGWSTSCDTDSRGKASARAACQRWNGERPVQGQKVRSSRPRREGEEGAAATGWISGPSTLARRAVLGCMRQRDIVMT